MRLNPEWIDDHLIRVGRVEYLLTTDLKDLHGFSSSNNRFVLGKTKRMIDDVVGLRDVEDIRRIVDIGIFKGGSVALYAQLFSPEKLVAIEYLPDPVGPLSDFIVEYGLEERVKPYYGTDQSDAKRLAEIVEREFIDRTIDLVVDDASHFYFETRASFNVLFPCLRPGGIYVIEDWGWAHWTGDLWQKGEAISTSRPAMSNLLFEICMLSASRPDLVDSIHVTTRSFVVRKGSGDVPRNKFNLSDHYLCRDRWFKPSM